ncbi:MAG TPA: tRNA preQ1(34) S-adenosylmethionine ribosyltransferase-isomerase QueA [Acidimicrobiia bacterium]
MKVSDFLYDLPESSIAQSAIEPRHAARLLDTRDLSDHGFLDFPELLAPGDLVVVNETRVRAARLEGRRQGTGGRVELLILEHLGDGSWQALARPARRLRPGAVVELKMATATVIEALGEGLVTLTLDSDDPKALIASTGTMPLPPYFTGSLNDPGRYQTMFANLPGSAAAPTAGLHFTPEVIYRLRERGIGTARVDLHVSLDTFRPMTVEHVEDHVMHTELCSVPEETAKAIYDTRTGGGRVVAVGTTVVRTLESLSDGRGGVRAGSGATGLFLRPGSRITVPDLLVTNFHLPGSTLLVLLEAFMGPGWRKAYGVAVERGYRFLSFGDAMLAERAPS